MVVSAGLKLLPFLCAVSLYVLFQQEEPSPLAAVLKCLPVISLGGFILLHGSEHEYSKRILIGLIFGCCGDLFLVWHELFVIGMIFFILCHVLYISAFGFQPSNKMMGLIFYAIAAAAIPIITPRNDPALLIGVPIYILIIMTMTWRALSRIGSSQGSWTWAEIFGALGAIMFCISDCSLGIHFFHTPLPNSTFIIMSTYYAAQLGIALSVLDCDPKRPKNARNMD